MIFTGGFSIASSLGFCFATAFTPWDALMSRKSQEVHILASGSDGNCAVIRDDDTCLMIDAGLSGNQIERGLNEVGIEPYELAAILITHEHRDHVMGAGVLSRRYQVPVGGNRMTLSFSGIDRLESPIVFETSRAFRVGTIDVLPLPISHDAAEPNAFLVSYGGKRCLIATDLGVVTDPIQAALMGCDLVVLEANHDLKMLLTGPYPHFLKEAIRGRKGHLSNADCARALKSSHKDGRKIFLAHLSRKNNRPDLACETVADEIDCHRNEVDCLLGTGDTRSISLC